MDIQLLIIFSGLTIINVILQTIKSLCTIRCGRAIACIVNCIAYGLYTYVIFFTNSEGLSIHIKALITALANLVGVGIASAIFDKMFSKEVRWRIDVTVPIEEEGAFINKVVALNLSHIKTQVDDTKWCCYSIYTHNKEESKLLKTILPTQARYNIFECAKTL